MDLHSNQSCPSIPFVFSMRKKATGGSNDCKGAHKNSASVMKCLF